MRPITGYSAPPFNAPRFLGKTTTLRTGETLPKATVKQIMDKLEQLEWDIIQEDLLIGEIQEIYREGSPIQKVMADKITPGEYIRLTHVKAQKEVAKDRVSNARFALSQLYKLCNGETVSLHRQDKSVQYLQQLGLLTPQLTVPPNVKAVVLSAIKPGELQFVSVQIGELNYSSLTFTGLQDPVAPA